MNKPKLLTTIEVAELLSLHSDTVRRMRAEGTGPAFVRIGKAIRYSPEAVQAFMAARTEGGVDVN